MTSDARALLVLLTLSGCYVEQQGIVVTTTVSALPVDDAPWDVHGGAVGLRAVSLLPCASTASWSLLPTAHAHADTGLFALDDAVVVPLDGTTVTLGDRPTLPGRYCALAVAYAPVPGEAADAAGLPHLRWAGVFLEASRDTRTRTFMVPDALSAVAWLDEPLELDARHRSATLRVGLPAAGWLGDLSPETPADVAEDSLARHVEDMLALDLE